MAKLIIRNAYPSELNGEYELDLASGFTKAEYFVMKKEVGVVIGDMASGSAVDVNVMTAWALVCLRRAGKEHLFPAFMETTDEQTDWEFPSEEVADEALPPTSETNGGERGSNATELSESSGPSTNGSSDGSPETTPLPTGSPPWGTGAA